MTRETESGLLRFCVAQRERFDAGEWLAYPHPRPEEWVAAVLFLAGVDWYGHRKELLTIAETLRPGSTGHLAELVQLTGFDLARFSQSLRRPLGHPQGGVGPVAG